MVSFTRVLSVLFAFTGLLPVLFALPFTPATNAASNKHTHRTHYVGAGRSLKVESYHPESIFHAFGAEGEEPFPEYGPHRRSSFEPGGAAVSFLASKLSVSEDSVHLRNTAQGQMANHAFLVQKINGVPVANAVANVAFNNKGKVSSFSSSFVEHTGAADIYPSVSLGDAIATAERTLDGTYDGHPTTLEFLVQPDGFAALTHVIQIRNVIRGTWYKAFVDAHENTLLSVTDFVRKSSYYAVPYMEPDSSILGFVNISNPENMSVSPNGWHQEFNTTNNHTSGNNVFAFNGLQLINVTIESSPGLNFDYVPDFTQDPTTPTNLQAAITNAFYVVNMCHDLAYLYGFTEETFNFQTNNFNKTDPDMGYDRVLVSVQDPRGTDGTDFAILPDGQSCEMRLYLYTDFFPQRDSAFQNDLILHECQHGANNRMTGGGTADCYQSTEAGGIDEGYGDVFADVLSQGPDTVEGGFVSDFIFGANISNSDTGLRTYPYSVSRTTNPLTYSSLQELSDPHGMGEVWANILHNVYCSLAEGLGWTWLYDEDPSDVAGNTVFLQLLYDALLKSPCNPTFLQVRDVWIQAETTRYNNMYMCLLWRGFASRGLGIYAANYTDDFTLPPECPTTASTSST